MRSWRRPVGVVGGLLLAGASLVPACVSRADAPFTRQTDHDTGGSGGTLSLIVEAGTPDTSVDLPPAAPHAVLGVAPPHGSFAGGSVALISGNGFTSDARVWFGSMELDASSVIPIDPQRVQVTVPAGHAGPVDVIVQDGGDSSTREILSAGYTYDQFYADPAVGPTSGGTTITLHGDGTHWDKDSLVAIDQNPCPITAVASPEELTCTTPAGTQGAKPIQVTTLDAVIVNVQDAFTYSNSDNGYKGGLSGNTLDDNLRVLALDNISGLALSGATVIVGSDLASADVLQTDANGIAIDSQAGLGPKRTVTVAHKCYQPQTFVDVPVDTVTVFLDPVLSPACGSKGDLPPSGGTSTYAAGVSGEVVWPAIGEFKRTGWTEVPVPQSPDEALVAYVFRLSSSPTDRFTMPDASQAVTPMSSGSRGYAFNTYGEPGNFTLYALAGIENRALKPATFVAYQMGLVRGVAAQAGETKTDIYVPIDVDLDHTLNLNLSPPAVTTRGPDRVQGSASIQVGNEGFASLPNGYISRNLPLSGALSFVGVPPLTGSLLGTNYIATARAVTGEAGGTPLSVVGLLSATTTSDPLQIEQFVEVPALSAPVPNSVWDGKSLASTRAAGGAPIDVFVYDVESGGGLIAWKIYAPGNDESFTLPDLAALSPDLALERGSLTITVNAARVTSFNYGALVYRNLSPRGWAAYATDVFYANY